jgi:hypothetical protein
VNHIRLVVLFIGTQNKQVSLHFHSKRLFIAFENVFKPQLLRNIVYNTKYNSQKHNHVRDQTNRRQCEYIVSKTFRSSHSGRMTSSRTRLLKRPKLTVIFSLEKFLKVVTGTDPITCFEWNFVFVFINYKLQSLRQRERYPIPLRNGSRIPFPVIPNGNVGLTLGGMSQGSGGVKVACIVTPDTHQSLIPYMDPLVLVGAFHRYHSLSS